MKKCKRCKLYYPGDDSNFCPYCGKTIYRGIKRDEYEVAEIEAEWSSSSGAARLLYWVKRKNGQRLFSFLPDFMVDRIYWTYIYRDAVWMHVAYKNKHSVYRIGINAQKAECILEISGIPDYWFLQFFADAQTGDLYFHGPGWGIVWHYYAKENRVAEYDYDAAARKSGSEYYIRQGIEVSYLKNDIFLLKNPSAWSATKMILKEYGNLDNLPELPQYVYENGRLEPAPEDAVEASKEYL